MSNTSDKNVRGLERAATEGERVEEEPYYNKLVSVNVCWWGFLRVVFFG